MASFGQVLAGKAGKLLSAVPIKEVKSFGNSLQSYGGNKSGQPFVSVASANYTPPKQVLGSSTSVPSFSSVEPSAYSSIQGYNTPTGGGGSYAPSTGGQPTGGGGGNGGGGGYDPLAGLRSAWDSSRSALESQLPTYEADFNNFNDLVNKNIASAQDTVGTQTADVTKRYGDSLKNLLQTSRDLGQRTRSTFSGLGSLDSSSFGDEILKQEQADKEGIGNIDQSQNRDISDINKQFATYKDNSLSSINSQRNEVDRLKAGVRQAIANNNIQEAGQLSNYLQQIQGNQDSLRTNLALAQAQGTDVIGNLQKINGIDFNNLFGQNLSNRANGLISKLVIPTGSTSGSGYIGSGSVDDPTKRLGYQSARVL